MVNRCDWIEGQPDYYVAYHDNDWCKPEYDDRLLFKWLLLESFHVGLSWRLILSKESSFAAAFDDYDYTKIANYSEKDIDRLMEDTGIIRHRGKIEAAIANAQHFMAIQKEWGSFCKYIWHFTDDKVIEHRPEERTTQNDLSDRVSDSLKKYGFKYIGSVTIYSYLQAIGIINDHDLDCDFR